MDQSTSIERITDNSSHHTRRFPQSRLNPSQSNYPLHSTQIRPKLDDPSSQTRRGNPSNGPPACHRTRPTHRHHLPRPKQTNDELRVPGPRSRLASRSRALPASQSWQSALTSCVLVREKLHAPHPGKRKQMARDGGEEPRGRAQRDCKHPPLDTRERRRRRGFFCGFGLQLQCVWDIRISSPGWLTFTHDPTQVVRGRAGIGLGASGVACTADRHKRQQRSLTSRIQSSARSGSVVIAFYPRSVLGNTVKSM